MRERRVLGLKCRLALIAGQAASLDLVSLLPLLAASLLESGACSLLRLDRGSVDGGPFREVRDELNEGVAIIDALSHQDRLSSLGPLQPDVWGLLSGT